ncbi:hypothetical protein A2380_04075 [candidate division WWE3 bacterium RIFOXYB1_FULL_43_24]|uniref:Lactate dehydrogenase and related dehydrogenase n=2 Tax=Katanobacteria TaxID=422282 RepID=A0A0G0YJH6_UNCKA|nr:MAG: Lactate dehydrogenase and related dehydrogenase [candidate division WWE3 bacterium GW2011_GWF1_42_14]KKS39897.1 MAG: Lactate dehydrogenase and related dehydrogenase [candidate division WWE3 bacterium GW2011_GWE1_42_16]KKS65956.1 MAG: Lactate dehydrogenase and related dehydrogenase [candidate division WWE3 bacterium GW2011_GWB1_42_6]OGC59420.1 MAG: hypothetical protein A2212_00765 [candidate division WWE3 bacterium RIFOXYA1_FULL_42_9]OGC69945.1 MAG: hypothetical protein A2380_04075 [cand
MKLLITREIPQAGINILKQYKDIELDYRQGAPLSEKEMLVAVKDVDAIIPSTSDKVNKKIINAAKKLRVIAAYSVGFDHIDVVHATSKNIFVGNTPGDLTESVAEHALALMLSAGRRIPEADKFCRTDKNKYWNPMDFVGPKILGDTLGIIGFGRIGQHLARMAKNGLNMRILYTDVNGHPEAESLLDAEKVELDYLLENSDFISIHCNLTPETENLIGENEFRKMKPLAYIINTARGKIINEEALSRALKQNYIAGAALDVFANEPEIYPDLKLLDNIVLTPHIGSATWEARLQMARMAAENVVDVLISNKPPRYLVNKTLAKETVASLI